MSESDRFIPLLSGKAFEEFTPSEFKAHVISLYHKPEPKRAKPKEKKPYTFHVNKKGTLSLRINREPKWLTAQEIESIVIGSGKSFIEVTEKLTKNKIEVR